MDVIVVVIGIASLGLMYWQVRIMKAAAPPLLSSTETLPRKPGISYWPVIGMAVLVIAAWVPYFLRLGEPERVMAMTMWTTTKDGCLVVADGAKLAHFKDKYNLAVLCGFSSPKVDQFQDTVITVSSPFSIVEGNIAMEAQWTPQMQGQLNAASTATPPQPTQVWNSIILIPKKEDISRIKRLSDVRAIGGKVVINCEPIE